MNDILTKILTGSSYIIDSRLSGKVCKTFIRRFDSDPRLQLSPLKSFHSRALGAHYPIFHNLPKKAKVWRIQACCQDFCQARRAVLSGFLRLALQTSAICGLTLSLSSCGDSRHPAFAPDRMDLEIKQVTILCTHIAAAEGVAVIAASKSLSFACLDSADADAAPFAKKGRPAEEFR